MTRIAPSASWGSTHLALEHSGFSGHCQRTDTNRHEPTQIENIMVSAPCCFIYSTFQTATGFSVSQFPQISRI